MVVKRSDRNQKKDTRASLAQQPPKKMEDMSVQERKQNIQHNGEQIKLKLLDLSEKNKDATKQVIGLYIKELMTYEDIVDKKDAEIRKLKALLEKHKIKIE